MNVSTRFSAFSQDNRCLRVMYQTTSGGRSLSNSTLADRISSFASDLAEPTALSPALGFRGTF